MLAQQYAIKYGKNVTGVIVSNMNSSIDAMEQHINNVLRKQLPQDINNKMLEYERNNNTHNNEYETMVNEYLYTKHICRIVLFPEPVTRMFRQTNWHIYNYMQGANEMLVTGKMQGWTVYDKLHTITVPILFISGKNDTMNHNEVKRASELVQNGECWISEVGSHSSYYDDQVNYFKTLLSFIFKHSR